MNKTIRKFNEHFGYGRVTNRVAYVIEVSKLPPPAPHCVWREDTSFDFRDALGRDAELKRVYDKVQEIGYATVDKLV